MNSGLFCLSASLLFPSSSSKLYCQTIIMYYEYYISYNPNQMCAQSKQLSRISLTGMILSVEIFWTLA